MSEKIQHKFNVNTAGLATYVDKNEKEILRELQMVSPLAEFASVYSGVKSSKTVPFMSTTATWQSDACSYNASDTTYLTEKTLTVGAVAVMEDICPKLLKTFWAEQLLRKGSAGDNDIPAEISKVWTDLKVNLNKYQMNIADWQGNTGSGSANLNKYDGLIKIIWADGDVIDGNTSDATTATTASNILARMEEAYLAIPEVMRAGAPDGKAIKWYLPQAYLDMYVVALRAANLFHYKSEEGHPLYYGTQIQLIPQSGLGSQDKMFITEVGNFMLALDGENDEDAFEVWYSKDDRTNHSVMAFKRGWNIKFGSHIVKWGLGAS